VRRWTIGCSDDLLRSLLVDDDTPALFVWEEESFWALPPLGGSAGQVLMGRERDRGPLELRRGDAPFAPQDR
jgi:hypothetical protein